MTEAEHSKGGWRRYLGIAALAARRVASRLGRGHSSRTLLAIGIVGLAVALLLLVTGISVGVASQSTVYGDDVDYWIVPQQASTLTSVVTVDGPQLGNVHATSSRIRGFTDVRYATPFLIELVRIRASDSGEPEFILGIGIIPSDRDFALSGLSTGELTPGDPHYNDGAYDGPTTGEVVLSPAAASLLNASTGANVAVMSAATGQIDYSYTVTGVGASGPQTLGNELPVAVFHLSELQSLTGAQSGDQADQILVRTNRPGVRGELAQVYPEASVVSRTGIQTKQLVDSELPLAVAVTALIVSVGVSALFVATTIGLEVEADRQLLAVFGALGFPVRDRLIFVAVTTLTVTVLGGLLGIGLAFLGTLGLNYLLGLQFGVDSVVAFRPLFVVYGLGVAILAGLIALPYPLVLARRTEIIEELSR